VVTLATPRQRHHNHPLIRIFSDSPGIVPDYSSALDFPVSPPKMQVGPADASRPEPNQNFPALDLWLGDVFNFDVFWSVVDGGFQKLCTLPLLVSFAGSINFAQQPSLKFIAKKGYGVMWSFCSFVEGRIFWIGESSSRCAAATFSL
jgi:hypothetical protein